MGNLSNFNLTQYCPTVDDLWNAYVVSGKIPATSTPENFILSILGPDNTYMERYIFDNYTNIHIDGSTNVVASPYCLIMDSISTTIGRPFIQDVFVTKIPGSIIASNASTMSAGGYLLPIGQYVGANFSQIQTLEKFVCTYFSGGTQSVKSITFDLPIIPLYVTNPLNPLPSVNIFGAQMFRVIVDCYKPMVIFWKVVTKDGNDYLCPAYYMEWASQTATSPLGFYKFNGSDMLDELIEMCQ